MQRLLFEKVCFSNKTRGVGRHGDTGHVRRDHDRGFRVAGHGGLRQAGAGVSAGEVVNGERDLGRVDDTGLDQILVLVGGPFGSTIQTTQLR